MPPSSQACGTPLQTAGSTARHKPGLGCQWLAAGQAQSLWAPISARQAATYWEVCEGAQHPVHVLRP